MSPSTTAPQSTSNATAAQSNSNSNQRMRIFSGGRQVASFDRINIHHAGDSYSRRIINGQEQRVRNGTDLIVKDFVVKNESGSTRVPVKSPVSGYVQKGHQEYTKPDGTKGGAGHYVDIYDKPVGTTGRKKIGRMFHLDSESPLTDGSYIIAGTTVGIQGNTGGSTGPHHHVETLAEVWPEYIQAVQSGDFSRLQNLEVNRKKSSEHVHTDSAANGSNDVGHTTSSDTTRGNSTPTNANIQNANTDLKKVVALILKNAEKIKSDSGIDVTNPKGLGEAVMNYWRANNLDPEILKEQLSTVSGVDITEALSSTSLTNETPSVQLSVSNREYAA